MMTATGVHPTDKDFIRDCEQFDFHIDWLKNGWNNQDPYLQALYECVNPHYSAYLKRCNGYGDLEIHVDRDIDCPYAYKELIVLSLDKTECLNHLLVNTLSFYEGEVLKSIDRGLPDYHFEPFHVTAKNKTQLRAEIKRYGKYLHEKHSGDYGKICIKYY